MLKNAITLAAAVATALIPAAAQASGNEQRFTYEGQTYVYTTAGAPGDQVIKGYRLPGGDAFRLVVRGKWVSGDAGGVAVRFPLNDSKGAYRPVALASAR